jgi:hypothetical protein
MCFLGLSCQLEIVQVVQNVCTLNVLVYCALQLFFLNLMYSSWTRTILNCQIMY